MHGGRPEAGVRTLVLLLGAVGLLGCAESPAPTEVDGGAEGEGEGEPTCPANEICVSFFVDDRANRVFDDAAQLEWKGTFRLLDPEGDQAVRDGSWVGPFPRLHDDGPPPEGHEAPGSEAGDHVWTTRVRFPAPPSPQHLDYGAQWGGAYWIWSCNNASEPCAQGQTNGGLDLVPADAGREISAPGLILPEQGHIDLKLLLDTNDLAGDADEFRDRRRVKVKGSYGWWLPLTCSDGGDRGDELAGDGVFTCLLSEIKGPYEGLLTCGSDALFVFLLGADDKEYKVGEVPPMQGVRAFIKANRLAEWTEVEVERDRGPDGNTMIATPACD